MIPTYRAASAALLGAILAVMAVAGGAAAQNDGADIRRMEGSKGMMTSELVAPGAERTVPETLVFEPWQMLDDLFARDDYVLLMRHGPTDWSKRDADDVAPTDCANQRVMTGQGKRDMRNLGTLMAHNGLIPGKVMASEWCRNQQTLDALLEGIARVDEAAAERLRRGAETLPDLNLLLSLQGAPDVTGLREIIMNWDGGEGDGPLLLISHYTNIEELTTFRVYEGEMLMVDPDRDGRVLGYLRLKSAAPDVGHFPAQATGDDG